MENVDLGSVLSVQFTLSVLLSNGDHTLKSLILCGLS